MKRPIVIFLIIGIILLCGCGGNAITTEFPENSDRLQLRKYQNPDDSGDVFKAVLYEDRTYIPYGVLSNKIDGRDVDECLGHVIQKGSSSGDYQVFTMIEDMKHDYLMICQVNDGEVQEADFWRATDTRGRKIETPAYIDSLLYDYWGE